MIGGVSQKTGPHKSVMLAEVLEALSPRDGATYVDATFGAGGYSRAILDSADCRVLGIDRDPTAVAMGADLGRLYSGRLTVLCGRFGDMIELLGGAGVERVDGVAFDLGVSSMQLDAADRGFSFRFDGPLDMRMGRDGPSAADVVNEAAEEELADIIYLYGEERAARRIAKALTAARAEQRIERTGQLADLVRSVVRPAKDHLDPATRTFQALRIYVNDELADLEHGLKAAEQLLNPGGRLAVVSFHSLEDRPVKAFLQERAGALPRASRHLPETREARPPTFRLLHKGTRKPGAAEIAANPRSRSARLRAAERSDAPAWAA